MSYKNNKANRVLAAVLSVLMIATLVPASVITAFALPSETTYNFTVKDAEDNPIKDATFTFDVDGVEEVKTDADGKVSVALSENTECKYVVEKIGYEKVEDAINAETVTDIDIQLEKLATLTVAGVVCDDENNPLEGVEIVVTGYCEYNTQTNADGEFTIANVYADQKYTLTAVLDGYKKVSQKLILDESNEITLSLKKEIADFGFADKKVTYNYTTDVISGIVAKSETYADAVVKYTSSDDTVATIDENTGDITCVSVGDVVITATVEETDEYLKTTATVDVKITKGTQANVEWLNSVPTDLTWKDSFTNVLSGGNGGTVTYSSDDEEVAKVDSTGKVTFLKPGEVKITGVMNGGELYDDAEGSYTIKVDKAEQEALVFEEKYPDAIFYGDTLENVATGGSVESKVEYKSSDDSIATVDKDGNVTTHKSGEVEITATIAGNELYEAVSESYKLTIYKAEQKAEFLFIKGAGDKEIAYGEEFANAAMGGENSPITYSSSDDEIASVDSEGKITTHKAGTVTITATNPEDDRFNKKEISYKLTVTLAGQTVEFKDTVVPAIIYGDEYENKATAKTEIEYSSSDETVVKVNAKTGKLEILKSGTVEITAKAKETNQYKEASASYSLTIKKAEQGITFELGSTPETTFNVNDNKYINAATTNAIAAGEDDIDCVYSVVSGSEFVDGDINKTTGAFKIKGAGTIVVNVAFDSNDRYNLATSSYTLTVKKANQTIAFPEDAYETYSETIFNINQPVAKEKGKHGTGKITYSVKADQDAVVSEIDSSTGEIVFTRNAGTATILATKAADANYESAVAEYNVTYKLVSVNDPADYYTLSGDKIDADSGWFTGNVSIVAKEGYKLSYEKNRRNANWQDELTDAVTKDGENKVTFYAKNIEKDSITSQITVVVKKDTVAPVVSLEVEDISVWDNFLTFIKEGKSQKDKALYAVEASDATSGIAETVYYVDYTTTEVMSKESLDALDASVWTTNEPIAQNSKCVVYARVTDIAGNYVYVSSNGIVFDAAEPAATITLPSTAEGTDYYTDDVLVTIDVTDVAPSSGIKEVTYKTYSSYDAEYTDDDVVYNKTIVYTNKENPAFDELTNAETINFTLEAQKHNSDNVKIEVIVVDNAGNKYSTEKTLKISVNEPEISVAYQDLASKGTGTDGVVYYNENREAYITIKCRTSIFDKVAATKGIVVTAKNADGNVIDGNFTIDKWVTVEGETPDAATHTAIVTFKENARYNFTADYTDMALLSAEQYKSDIFAIDKDEPTGSVTIDGNVWTVLLKKLTFGLWSNKTVSVTATADDVTGEIKKIEYHKSNKDDIISLEELKAEKDWTEYAESSVPSDEQFTVYFKITDYSDNVTYICSDGYIVDTTSSNIILDYDEPNQNGYYEENINVNISVNDKKDNNEYYSGIQKVEYWVTADDVETQREVLYSYEYVRNEGPDSNGGTLTIKEKGTVDIVKENAVPTKDDLKLEFSKDIIIDAKANNSDNVKLYVEVTDNAGNISNNSISMRFDETAPTIDVSYDTNICNEVDGRGYFAGNREATVIITERPNSFDAKNATKGIVIQALDVDGNVPVAENGKPYVDENGNAIFDEDGYVIDKDSFIGEWKLTENTENPDESTYEAKIKYDIEANYTFSISYTDNASNSNDSVVYAEGTNAPEKFTIDKTNPTATVTVADYTWDKLLDFLTFGLWSKETVFISATADDITSPVHIQYYKTDSTELLNEVELDAVDSWEDYTGEIEVANDERLTVYLKVTDNAGNFIYINSDGYIVDKTDAIITLVPKAPNANGVYNGDVEVLVSVNDKKENNDYYSGIQKIEYWVEADGVETQRESLYSFEYKRDEGFTNTNAGTLTIKEKGVEDIVKTGTVPTKDDLKSEFSKTIIVDSVKNNSSDVKVFVEVTDNAGNISNDEVALDIDITAPVIDITYDNNNAYKVVEDHGYFPADREATIVITERPNHFNADDATKGITISAKDASGKTVIEDCTSLISDWDTEEDTANPDNSKHIATVTYDADANYEFSITYTDLADNECKSVNTEGCTTPYSFTVDKTAPTGTITVGELGTWAELIELLTFGLWSKETVEVSQTNDDITADIESVSYYKTTETVALKAEQLMAIADESWVAFNDAFEIPANEQFTVYVRIVDNAGNVTFISTDGVIVDNVKPEFIPSLENTKPEIILATVEDDVNGIYNSDVTVAVKVIDPVTGDTYSGLKEIRYEITNMGKKTQEGVLYSFGEKMPTKDKLIQIWEKKSAIIVDSQKNNSNKVVVKVFAVDNAGNENEVALKLKVDITAPKINVSYNNNDGDTNFKGSTYFKKARVATIVVTERNFNPEDVDVEIKNTHGDDKTPVISKWKTVTAKGNGDATTHTATITYKQDGHYTFGISCVDLAGNKNKKVDFGDSLAPKKFTVDKKAPTFTVTYDNNEALNGNYYKAQRVATIVVKEHNFETSRINIKLSATDNGVKSDLPAVSKWASDGDIHTATITFAADSKYTFDFDYTDKAGNKTADMEQQEFYVDKTNPVVSITKIVDNSANNDEEIGFVLSATDTNFDSFAPEVTVTDINGNSLRSDVGAVSDIANGKSYVVKNIEADGIYRVKCTVVDKAGNAFTQVTLQRENGSTYVENRSGNDTLVTFSVNRDGSTYELNKSTAKLVKNYYVQSVDEDVVIDEINVDELSEFKVTLNDKELVKNKDYTVAQTGGNGSWRKYTYSIKKELFDKEGEYKIVVSSKDAAGNDAFSDIKDATVNFVVDQTAPIVTVSGLASKQDYQVESQKVTIIPTDDGGALKSIIVRLVDEEGKVIEEIIKYAGNALDEALEKGDGKIVFEIAEGVDQNVQIVCNDNAVDADGKTNTYDETFDDIDISPSAWKLFWADPFLRWGSIAGVLVVAGLIIFFVVRKKKKDEEENK